MKTKVQRKNLKINAKFYKQEKGITLIALVVTIVVLLILAGVSISLVLNNNGVISKAKDAKNQYAEAQTNDEKQLNEVSDWIDTKVGDIAGGSGNGGNGGESTNLPTTETTKPYMPGDNFTIVAGTTLDNGLTIQDATENGNQYVWVEVPKTATVYPTAGLNITEFTTEEYTNIENDLHTYTSTYRNNTSWKDEWHEDKNNSADWYTSEQYTVQKQKMLKSVYQNGGFWVAKYEAGLTEENKRTSKTPAPTIAPQSKANLVPYNYVTKKEAKKLAEMITYTKGETTYTGSLMFGVQWDLVLKFIETKKIATDATIVSKLNSNSTTIGNCFNNQWNITNTVAKYSNDDGSTFNACPYQKTSNANVLLTTGSDSSFSLMNIYDIAGNVWEWTLEYTSYGGNPCACRGGGCINSGFNSPASDRSYNATCSSSLGFRLSLY